MKFLNFINCSDGNCRVCGKSKAVFVHFSAERTHVLDLKNHSQFIFIDAILLLIISPLLD